MFLARIARQIWRRWTGTAVGLDCGICNPDDLKKAVQRERSRADRTGGQFAIVSFFSKHDHDLRQLLPLIHHLKQRSRAVDDLGWDDDGKLWLILADCTEAAARRLGTEHCQRFSSATTEFNFTLYHYMADGSDDHRDRPSSPGTAVGQSSRPAMIPSMASDSSSSNAEMEPAHSMASLFVKHMPWWKRTLDITISGMAMLLLSPLFAIIAIAIKWSSPGPVLFRQLRSGRGGKPFVLYKFRSMVVDAEAQKRLLLARNEQDGPAFKMERDPRVTKVGRILRAFSLDELPQLWNVLRGEMSLVGPRPLPVDEARACLSWQKQRSDVTPGLTCIWQVKDRRSKIPFVDWARMDIRYISGRSIWMDLRLLCETFLFVIRRKGV